MHFRYFHGPNWAYKVYYVYLCLPDIGQLVLFVYIRGPCPGPWGPVLVLVLVLGGQVLVTIPILGKSHLYRRLVLRDQNSRPFLDPRINSRRSERRPYVTGNLGLRYGGLSYGGIRYGGLSDGGLRDGGLSYGGQETVAPSLSIS